METFICSASNDVKQRLIDVLSENNKKNQSFSNPQDLISALNQVEFVNLIYHLDDTINTESQLQTIQSKFREKINTLALSNLPDSEQGVRLLNHNVRGYANSWIAAPKLMVALSVIQQGEIWAGAVLIEHLLNKSTELNSAEQSKQSIDQALLAQLSEREKQIAQQVFTGQQNKLIADTLNISERTVKAHLTAIYKKLHIRNRLELSLKLNKKSH